EEGSHHRASEYQAWKPSDVVRRLFRESGMLTALGLGQTPIISLVLGRAVGGSSLLTGGVCFRIPGEVHHRWVRDLGLDELSERALEGAYEEVERRLHVREVPVAMRSEATSRSVDVAYLPSAIEHGARVVSDALVERVVVEHGRASGVAGRLLGGPPGAP